MKSNEEKIVGNKYQLRDFLCLGVLSRYWGEKKTQNPSYNGERSKEE